MENKIIANVPMKWIESKMTKAASRERSIMDIQKFKRLRRDIDHVEWILAIEITNDINYTLIYEMINCERAKKNDEGKGDIEYATIQL